MRSNTKSVTVAYAIVDRIVDSGLGPDPELAAEVEMIAEHGVGPGNPPRGATPARVARGHHHAHRSGGGPGVSDRSAAPMAANLALHLQRSEGRLRDVMAVRRVFEPEIAAYAASHRTDLAPELMTLPDRHHARGGWLPDSGGNLL
jgi:DNA-binding FadR family transcriptional regulator